MKNKNYWNSPRYGKKRKKTKTKKELVISAMKINKGIKEKEKKSSIVVAVVVVIAQMFWKKGRSCLLDSKHVENQTEF